MRCTVTFENNSVRVTKDREVLATGYVKDDLYVIELNKNNRLINANETNVKNNEYLLWHRRLAHIGFSSLDRLNKEGALGQGVSKNSNYF